MSDMQMPTHEELVAMANVFDEFMMEFCTEYNLSPLAASGIFLARMSKLATELEYQTQYKRLLTEIAVINETTQTFMANNASTTLQ